MASYLDQIPQFREYVPQAPLEVLMKAGMYKQEKYEQNVQKIQDEMEKIAGLDIYRDIDKKYLQSKLDELGGKLRMFAAGDFSNFQLANSVSGMTKQIAKDPKVQRDVASTAKIREESGIMKEAMKKGESSEANIWDFNETVNAYANSTDLNESFTGRYKPYKDVNKKWMETLKSLHPSLAEYDLPYEMMPDGKTPDYTKIAAAMTRITKETVSTAQIENALRSNLSPDDMEQLSIDGRYRFRGYNQNDLKNYKKNQYDSEIRNNDEKIEFLKKYSQTVTSDSKEYNASIKTIKELEELRDRLKSDYSKQLQLIDSDPDAVKAEIYKDGAISQFANAFAWETNKRLILDNPVLKTQQWERTFALDQSKFNLAVRSQNWQEYKDTFDMDMKTKEYNLKVQELQTSLFGSGTPFTTYTGEDTQIKDPNTAMMDNMNQKLSGSNAAVKDIAARMGTTPELLEASISEYQQGNKNAIPKEWRSNIDQIVSDRTEAMRISKALQKIDNEIANDPNFASKKKQIDQSLNSLSPITIGNTTFSQQEVLDYLTKRKTRTKNLFGASGQLFDEDILTSKEKILYNAEKYTGNLPIPGTGATAGLNMITGWIIKKVTGMSDDETKGKVSNQVNRQLLSYDGVLSQTAKLNVEIMQEKNKRLLPISGTYIPMSSNINVTDKSRPYVEGIATAMLNRYKVDNAGAEGLDVDGAFGLFDKDKNQNFYRKVIQGDKTYLSVSRGGNEYLIPTTAMEAAQLPSFPSEPSPLQRKVTTAQYMNNGNTAIPQPGGGISVNSYDAMFQAKDFQNVKKLQPFANLQWDHSNNSVNYLTLGINTAYGPKVVKIDDYPMDADGASKFVSQLTDQHIAQLFLSNAGTKNDAEVLNTLKSFNLIK